MDVFVINLERSQDRRESISRELGRVGVSFELFRAVDAAKGEHEAFSEYDEAYHLKTFGMPLLPGEIATFASHYLLWRKCAESGRPMMIFEDDTVVSDRFPIVMDMARDRIDAHGLIKLSSLRARPYRVIEAIDETYSLVRYLNRPDGSNCYCLSPRAAQILVDNAARWHETLDLYLDRFWTHGVGCHGILPFEAFPAGSGSDIGSRPRRTGSMAKLRRELNRATGEIGRRGYNLRQTLSGQ